MRGGHLLKPDCVLTTIGLPPFSSLSGGIPDVTMVYTKALGTHRIQSTSGGGRESVSVREAV
jgi:hypothetical protein